MTPNAEAAPAAAASTLGRRRQASRLGRRRCPAPSASPACCSWGRSSSSPSAWTCTMKPAHRLRSHTTATLSSRNSLCRKPSASPQMARMLPCNRWLTAYPKPSAPGAAAVGMPPCWYMATAMPGQPACCRPCAGAACGCCCAFCMSVCKPHGASGLGALPLRRRSTFCPSHHRQASAPCYLHNITSK